MEPSKKPAAVKKLKLKRINSPTAITWVGNFTGFSIDGVKHKGLEMYVHPTYPSWVVMKFKGNTAIMNSQGLVCDVDEAE